MNKRNLFYGAALLVLGALVSNKYGLVGKAASLTGWNGNATNKPATSGVESSKGNLTAAQTSAQTPNQAPKLGSAQAPFLQAQINQELIALKQPSFYLPARSESGQTFLLEPSETFGKGDPFSGIKDPNAAVEEPVANEVLDPMQAGLGNLPDDLLPDDMALPDMGLPDMNLPELGLDDLGLNLDEAGLPKDLATEPLAEPEDPNPDGELDLEAALINLEIQKEPETAKPENLPKREPKKVTILHPKPLPPPEPPNLAYKGFMKIGGQTIALVSYQNRNLRLKQNQPLTDGWKILRIDRKFLLLTHPQSGAERMVKRN